MKEILLLEVLKGIIFGLGLFGTLIVIGSIFKFHIHTTGTTNNCIREQNHTCNGEEKE